MLKKATLHPRNPVRAETPTFPDLRSRSFNASTYRLGTRACLGRLRDGGWNGRFGFSLNAAGLDGLFEHPHRFGVRPTSKQMAQQELEMFFNALLDYRDQPKGRLNGKSEAVADCVSSL